MLSRPPGRLYQFHIARSTVASVRSLRGGAGKPACLGRGRGYGALSYGEPNGEPVIDLWPSILLGPLTMSVSEANAYVKQLLDDDATLADLWVRGEVGESRTYASGHTYFTLRDGT